ncbi:MAG TPA: MerR family transcriptional regulator [Myxococcaceae bacterium]|nr:MerR family transcriptional regulator [Myxococcaceae bacterium]
MDSFTPSELESIEREFPGGLLAKQILALFHPRGVRLSEATFRKYVQAGLLPRSRRVGQKGKHRGSQGLYPVEAVRRINAIKKMMAEGMTIEEIKRSFVFFKNHIDRVEHGLAEVLDGFESELAGRGFGAAQRRRFALRIEALRQRSQELVRDVAMLGSAVTVRGEAAATERSSLKSASGPIR